MSARFIRTDDWYYNNGRIFRDKLNKLNDDRNKSFEHLTDTLETFIYQNGILNDYSIETENNIDCDYNKVDNKLTITVYMSRDL